MTLCITVANYHGGMDFDISDIDHEKISVEVRIRLAARLEKFLDDLEPFVDPRREESMGEISPSVGNLYLAGIRAMGKLYQVDQRPGGKDMVELSKVERMLEIARAEAAAAAVAELTARKAIEGSVAYDEARIALADALRGRQAG
jgi:hypothetical protein